ncbi:MAG: FG-GAP-like repeat-containing protein, partial [Anaerolineae bacterium]
MTSVAAADLDGDGLPEVAIGTADHQLYILENDGGLVWRYEAGGVISAVALADLNGDGRAQVVVASADGMVSHLDDTGKPAWTFAVAGTASVSGLAWAVLPCLTTADLDRDGQVELLAGSYDGQVFALNGNGQMRWSFDAGRPVLGIWAGDVDGDGQPEIAPNPYRGGDLHLLETDGHLDWQQRSRGEVGQVQGGDLDGDGRAELVLLTASWDLFVYRGEGTLAWHSDAMALSHAHDTPDSGQLLVRDLDGDGRAEIVAVAIGPRPTIYTFQAGGGQLWAHTLGTGGNITRLAAHDVDGDGDLEIAVTTSVQEPVYLLDSGGRLLAEYRIWGTSGSLELADLDGDGRAEILVATETGLQVFGTSDQVERRQLWRSPSLGSLAALTLGDTDGDGRAEVLAGSQDGRVYALAAAGQILWDVPLQASVLALDAGDVDGDGRDEVVVGTWGGAGPAGGQVHLLDGGRRLWSVPAGLYVTGVTISGDRLQKSSETSDVLIVAGVGLASGGAVLSFDGDGDAIWQQEFAERLTTMGGHGEQVLAGTQGGRVYRLAADGAPLGEYELGSAVIGFGEGLAA